MNLDYYLEQFGGIMGESGEPRLVFTGAIAKTAWPEYPYAANARITRDSYDAGQKMMAAGDRCVGLFNARGQSLTLPSSEWRQDANDPAQLKELVNTLRTDKNIQARIGGH